MLPAHIDALFFIKRPRGQVAAYPVPTIQANERDWISEVVYALARANLDCDGMCLMVDVGSQLAGDYLVGGGIESCAVEKNLGWLSKSWSDWMQHMNSSDREVVVPYLKADFCVKLRE